MSDERYECETFAFGRELRTTVAACASSLPGDLPILVP
jgi:hypothetical protein